ncbi:hypothetical protein ALO79_200158 [Pseudomonas syringae pv. castaneae]|uniref:Uncharacterized protein n=1 Tax=Pseudomonas syringae pv. castaneae TaxID=264450 RepID=A0A0P9SER8_PSESX|nr:hypothetical protein ALO79_200158 [Pseudomonas syringae pv. castaneae]
MGSGATLDHAQAGHALGAELQQVRWRQFLCGDNRAGRHVELPRFSQQCPQYPLAQVTQIVGALGQQRTAQLLQYPTLRVYGLAPGVGRGAALVDAHMSGIQQGRIFQQRQMGAENRFFVAAAPGPGVVQGPVDITADVGQGTAQLLPLIFDVVAARILGQLNAIQPNQRSRHKAGGGAYAVQHAVFGRTSMGFECRRCGVGFFGQCSGQGRQQRLQCCFGIVASATDLHFCLLGDGKAHHPHQAVAGGRLAAEVQLRATVENLGGLAHQRRGACVQAAAVGDADLAEDLDADVRMFVGRNACSHGDDMQQRLADFHAPEGDGARLEVLAIGDDQQADQALAVSCHFVHVITQQWLAVADPGAFLDQHGKTVATQLDGVQPQVQQQFGAVVGPQGHGVAGTGDMDHFAVAGRVEGVVQRIDGDPVAHGTAGEHGVRDIGEGEHRAAERGAEGQLFIIVGHGALSSGCH